MPARPGDGSSSKACRGEESARVWASRVSRLARGDNSVHLGDRELESGGSVAGLARGR